MSGHGRFLGLDVIFVAVSSLSVAARLMVRFTGAERVAIEGLLEVANEAAMDLAGVADRDLVSTILDVANVLLPTL